MTDDDEQFDADIYRGDPALAYGKLLAVYARLERGMSEVQTQLKELSTKENQREGASRWWRAAGAFAATAALSAAGYALTLATSAAADHERVNILQEDLSEFHRDEDAEEVLEAERWERMGREFGQAQATIDTTKAVLERVERQLDRLEERANTRHR